MPHPEFITGINQLSQSSGAHLNSEAPLPPADTIAPPQESARFHALIVKIGGALIVKRDQLMPIQGSCPPDMKHKRATSIEAQRGLAALGLTKLNLADHLIINDAAAREHLQGPVYLFEMHHPGELSSETLIERSYDDLHAHHTAIKEAAEAAHEEGSVDHTNAQIALGILGAFAQGRYSQLQHRKQTLLMKLAGRHKEQQHTDR